MSSALTQTSNSAIKEKVHAYAVIKFVNTGTPQTPTGPAVTLQAWTPQSFPVSRGYAAAGTGVAGNYSSPSGTQLVASISRTSTGLFVLTLQGSYQRILSIEPTWLVTATALAANIAATTGIGDPQPQFVVLSDAASTDVTKSGGGIISFNTFGLTSGAPAVYPKILVDPLSGTQLNLDITLDNSGVI